MSILIFILGIALPGHAIQFLPCQRALQGSTWQGPDGQRRTIDPDSVVVAGPLSAHWETGFEESTAWSVIDDHVSQKLSGNGYDALFVLSEGDTIFLLDESGGVRTWGEYREYTRRGTVRLDGAVFNVEPNLPRLTAAPGQPAMADEDFVDAFRQKSRAHAIMRLAPILMRDTDKKIAPNLARHEAHLNDPARFISVGTKTPYELAIFESSFRGKLKIQAEGLTALAINDNATLQLNYGDQLFLLNERGEQFAKLKLTRFPAILEKKDLDQAKQAKRCVVIRRNY